MVECSDKRRHDGRLFRMKAAEAVRHYPRNTDPSQSEGFDSVIAHNPSSNVLS